MLPVTSAPIGAAGGHWPTGGTGQRRASDAHDGVVAADRMTIPASAGVRSPLRWLQPSQAAIVLSQVFRPPRERGRMWSTVVAGRRSSRTGARPAGGRRTGTSRDRWCSATS